MPGFDRTGPEGLGPMTGRGMGRCTNYGTHNKDSEKADTESRNQDQGERMIGNGFGFGFGFGRRTGGRGRRTGGTKLQNRFRNRL